MEKPALLLLALGTTACAPQVHAIGGPVPESTSAMFTCLTRELTRHGYRIQDSAREAGFIRAEKSRSSTGAQLLAGASYFTEVHVSIVESADGSEVSLQALPVKEEGGRRTSTMLTLPGSEREEVSTIAANCGVTAAL